MFQTVADADQFRVALIAQLMASGFRLAWTNTADAPPSPSET
jgi:hypothetical protein